MSCRFPTPGRRMAFPGKALALAGCVFASAAFAAPTVDLAGPQGWVRSPPPSPGLMLQYFSGQASPGFRPNLAVSLKPLAPAILDSLERSPERLGPQLAKAQSRLFPQFQVLTDEKREVGAARGCLLVSRYAIGNLDLAAFQFSARVGGGLLNVVYTCLARDLDRLRPEFEKSLRTLKLASGP